MQLLPLDMIPPNAFSWALGSVAIAIFGLRSLLSYRRTGNTLNRYFGLFGLLVAATTAGYSLPAFLTLNEGVLRVGYVVGSLFFYLSLIVQSRILWFIGFKNRLSYWWFLVPTFVLISVSWIAEILTSEVTIRDNFLYYRYSNLVGNLVGLLLVLLILPGGVLFIRQSFQQADLAARLKSLAIGLTYLIVGGSTFFIAVFHHGTDTPGALFYNTLGFGLILLILLIGPLWHAYKTKETLRSS